MARIPRHMAQQALGPALLHVAGLAAAILPLLAAAGSGGESKRDWPNVLDPLEAWTFDLGSQVGYRAAPASAAGGRALITVSITGPAPDWAIPMGSRSANLTASSAAGGGGGSGLRSSAAAVPCSKLLPPFCSCTGGAGHARNCSCSSCGKCGCKTCQICNNKPPGPSPSPSPPPHPPAPPSHSLGLPVLTFGAKHSGASGGAASSAAAAVEEAVLLPGSVNVQRRDTVGSVEVSASLAFVSANTSVVNLTARSLRTSGAALSLSLLIGGSGAKNATRSTSGDGVNLELPPSYSQAGCTCFQAPDFRSAGVRILGQHSSSRELEEEWVVSTEQGSFSATSSEVSLSAGGSISVYITITMGRAEACDAESRRVAAVGPISALTETRARWRRYLDAVLPPTATDDSVLVKNVRWSAVKALMTLINNWRYVPGRGQGIIPSFVKYDEGFWSWDSYKQAVATVIFDPELAKDQLRLITDARNRSSGHIPDLVKRCGVGGGSPGKPNLLSWAVMEIYTKTNDTAFVAEMFPIVEAFHHFVYITHDSQGAGMLSWQRGPESGMDNGVRFMFGGPTGGHARTVHNPQPSAQGGYDGQRSYTFDFWAVDMNSYLYREKVALAEMATVLGNATGRAYWQASAAQLLPKLQKMFYVPGPGDKGFFQDRYFNESSLAVQGCEGFAALFCGVASQEQASAVAKTLTDPGLFLANFSLSSVSLDNPHFNATNYWEGPTWLDQTWFASQGLRRYGFTALAAELKSRLFLRGAGMRHGDVTPLHEYYNPISGSPLGSPHFSWSAAHILMWAAESPTALTAGRRLAVVKTDDKTQHRELQSTSGLASCFRVTGTGGIADGNYRMCQNVYGEHGSFFSPTPTDTTTLLNGMPIYATAAASRGWKGAGWMWYDSDTSEWRVADCSPLLCKGDKLAGFTLARFPGDNCGPALPSCDWSNPCADLHCAANECCVLMGHEGEYQCSSGTTGSVPYSNDCVQIFVNPGESDLHLCGDGNADDADKTNVFMIVGALCGMICVAFICGFSRKRASREPDSDLMVPISEMEPEPEAGITDDPESLPHYEHPSIDVRTFATSNYKKAYDVQAKGVIQTEEQLFDLVGSLIAAYCAVAGKSGRQAEKLTSKLRAEARSADNLAPGGSMKETAALVWTSGQTGAVGKSLFGILQQSIRDDSEPQILYAARLARCINELCVDPKLPPGEAIMRESLVERKRAFRGTGFASEHRGFFFAGQRYRVPMYLATTLNMQVAQHFMRNDNSGDEHAIWTVLMAADINMYNAALVTRTHFAGEEEYLFAPFSVFLVDSVTWRAGTKKQPHEIVLKASSDNMDEPLDLPCAPWA
jgi:hypothetical protein